MRREWRGANRWAEGREVGGDVREGGEVPGEEVGEKTGEVGDGVAEWAVM